MNRKPFLILGILILAWFTFCFTLYKPKLLEYFFLPVIMGIVSGGITNWLYIDYQKRTRQNNIRKELKKFEGQYNVYHWRDLKRPDGCNYEINISLNEKAAMFNIHQTGTEDAHELIANIKIDELTFSYGEGNYVHPKKPNNPTGRIQVFLIDNGVINVDKTYLDIREESIFLPGWEKWQWRRNDLK
jgi:hypothetical protein